MERRKREECGGRWKVVDLSEMDGKDGYYGTGCALIREVRIFRAVRLMGGRFAKRPYSGDLK